VQAVRRIGIKVVLGIGSWTSEWMSANSFTKVASDETLRAKFAVQMAAIVKKFNVDGVFLKWTYPGCPMVFFP